MIIEQKFNVTLANGTTFEADSDGAGNLIIENIAKEVLSVSNLSEVTLESDGYTTIYKDQVLRTYMPYQGKIMIRLSDMTDIEKLEADYTAKIDYLAMMTDVDLEVM